jgi:D-hydroxyproline dehydrogenase subunit alpha
VTLGVDVAVVGGGPAGLAAAHQLGRIGARVLLIEEHAELGGQFFKQRRGSVLERFGHFRPSGAQLISAVRNSGVNCLTGHLVWGFQNGDLWLSRLADGKVGRIHAKSTLVATGAFEKTIPFPGWTLPGVCTPGCALHFATVDKVSIGQRVLVAGSGPFLLSVACALLQAGVSVVSVLEATRPYRISKTSLEASSYLARTKEMAQYLVALARKRVPLKQGWRVLEARGNRRVNRVRVGSDSQIDEFDVDALCVGYGFSPSAELIRIMGVECRRDPISGDLFPITDDCGRTSHPGVYVAGEVAGIGGIHAALNLGRLAALTIAADLGIGQRASRTEISRLTGLRRRLRRFAEITSSMYQMNRAYSLIEGRTVICRCECVNADAIRKVISEGVTDLQAVKGLTRAGMGPCQGRECGATVAGMVAEISGSKADRFPARMPIKPIRITGEMEFGFIPGKADLIDSN